MKTDDLVSMTVGQLIAGIGLYRLTFAVKLNYYPMHLRIIRRTDFIRQHRYKNEHFNRKEN